MASKIEKLLSELFGSQINLEVGIKRYWTIRAMRERAKFHPHFKTSPKMQEAVLVFDDWLLWNKTVDTGVSKL